MTIFEKKEQYDFITDNIEVHIGVMVNALERGAPEEVIIKFYEDKGYNSGSIFLTLTAAKLIFKARQDAPPKKTLIRRIV